MAGDLSKWRVNHNFLTDFYTIFTFILISFCIFFCEFTGRGWSEDKTMVHTTTVSRPGNGGVAQKAQCISQYHDQWDVGPQLVSIKQNR